MSEHDKNLHDGSSDPEGSEQPETPDQQSQGKGDAASASAEPTSLDDLMAKLQEHIVDPKLSEPVSAEAAAEAAASEAGSAAETEVSEEDMKLAAEYLNDLKRLQAEYQNYRKRVERDRETDKVIALMSTLRELVPVLDDLDRVDTAGDLEGSPLEAIAKKFRNTLERMGLSSFGKIGDVFDPNFHEAVFKNEVEGATEETIFDVIEIGYMVGDRELRPAKVAVQVPKS